MKKSIICLSIIAILATYCINPNSNGKITNNDTSNTLGTDSINNTKQNWTYQETTDEMSGDKSYFASCTSTNKLEFEFPYGGGSTFTLAIRNNKKSNNVYLSVDKGQFKTSIMNSESCRVKFDDGQPVNFSFVSSDDGSTDIIFFNSESKFISKLKKAKKVKIEAPFFNAGRQIIQFDVDGLKWDK